MSQPAAEPSTTVPGAVHRLVDVPGGRSHLLEQGTGPLVLMFHGFPKTSYSWRHHLSAVAAAGFRAVAVDARGYGRCSAPGPDMFTAAAMLSAPLRSTPC
ncbi:alpha/beta fold hydrolase [Streptomyces sp. NPDC005791]|uniref:alpha/beta fold hydrolase n=1 Tax=unclassified Streptomyces TaxID=2593676 RepID=UPI0033E608A4